MGSRDDYDRKRNDPVRWARYLEQDKIRKARRKEKMKNNPEFNEHVRQLQRDGCKKYRERVKEINEKINAEFGHLSSEEIEVKRKELTEQDRAERKKEFSARKNEINKQYRERKRMAEGRPKREFRDPSVVAEGKPKREKATPEELKRRKTERNRIAWAKKLASRPPKPPVKLFKPKADARIGTSGVARLNITRRTTMTKDEAAEHFGVSTGELFTMVIQGIAPRPINIIDGVTVYDREEVEKAKNAPDETSLLHFEKAPDHTKRKGYKNDTRA